MLPRLRLISHQLRPYTGQISISKTWTTTMSTFNLPSTSPSVPVQLTSDLSQDQLLSFRPFKTWLSTLQKSLATQSNTSHTFNEFPYKLRSITIQSVDFFGGDRIGFLKLSAEVSNEKGEKLPGSVFLRGGSVGMMLVLKPTDNEEEKFVVLTLQPRVPAGSLSFAELPAGMLDDSGTFAGGAAKEIKEEVGLEIPEDELVDMTKLALENSSASQSEEELQSAVYPSPGGSDEYIPLFLWEKAMDRKNIEELKGKLTGLREDGEKITLKIVKLEDLWKEGARDGKTIAAWGLYEGLKRTGKI